MRLIIVRHGETDRNRLGLDTGHAVIPLNAVGRCQASQVAERLATEKIDVIYSSDLLRAKETANIIAARHPQAKFILTPDLRERNFGEFTGHKISEREEIEKTAAEGFRNWRPQGGESIRDLKERAGRWYANLRACDADKAILVVGHGLFIYALLELAIEDGADVENVEYRHHNAAVTMLDIAPVGRARIIHLNDTSHL